MNRQNKQTPRLQVTDEPVKVWKYARGNNNQAIYVDYMNVTFYMSYNTCVAFSSILTGLVVQQNSWGTTTGAHLNAIDGGDHSNRVTAKEFEAKLAEMEQNQRRSTIAVYEVLKEKKETEFRDYRLAERNRLNAGYTKAGH